MRVSPIPHICHFFYTDRIFENQILHPKKWLKVPKTLKMYLKKSNICIFSLNLEKFTPDRKILHRHRLWQIWGMLQVLVSWILGYHNLCSPETSKEKPRKWESRKPVVLWNKLSYETISWTSVNVCWTTYKSNQQKRGKLRNLYHLVDDNGTASRAVDVHPAGIQGNIFAHHLAISLSTMLC